jgi:hypothetical protein
VPARRRRLLVVALALATVCAGALRGARLTWGLHDGVFFPDERYWVERVADVAGGACRALEPQNLLYPTAYGYLAAGVAEALHAVGLVGAPDEPTGTEALRAARLTSALVATAAVPALGLVGAALYGPGAGVAAAALLAVAPLDVMQTHYASVDSLLAALVVVVLAASWRLARRGDAASAVAAGLAVGLTAATKYTGGAFLSAPLWALLEVAVARRALRPLVVGGVALAAAAGAGFFVGCPRCVLDPRLLDAALLHHRLMTDLGGFENNNLVPAIGWWARPWLYQLIATLPYGLGLPFWALAVAGVGLALRARTLPDRLLVAALVPYFAVMGSSKVVFPRYMLPLFPPLALLAGRAGAALARRGRAGRVALAGAVAYGLVLCGSQVARFSWGQQETVAAWIAAHAPAGTAVTVPSYGPYFRITGPLAAHGLAYAPASVGEWFRAPTPFFVLPHWYAIAIRRGRNDPRLLADLARLEDGAAGYRPVLDVPIPWYLQRPLDVRLDPAFAVDLWQGAIGFTVYARD